MGRIIFLGCSGALGVEFEILMIFFSGFGLTASFSTCFATSFMACLTGSFLTCLLTSLFNYCCILAVFLE